jgi:hypothetical protein
VRKKLRRPARKGKNYPPDERNFGANSFDKRAGEITLFKLAGVVAQLVEHHNGIVGVRGSNPLGSTSLFLRVFIE